ncbi:hypothetical protein FAIPA1_220014 [Frankia sp. AiPs1]
MPTPLGCPNLAEANRKSSLLTGHPVTAGDSNYGDIERRPGAPHICDRAPRGPGGRIDRRDRRRLPSPA